MSYSNLTDEQKLFEAIRFVAVDQPMPEALKSFLHEAGLFDIVTQPSACPVDHSAA